MSSQYAALSGHITLDFVLDNLARGPRDRYSDAVIGSEALQDPRINEASDRSIEWAKNHGGLDERQEQRARQGKYLWLTAGAMLRECPLDDIELFAREILWAILIDDIADEQQLADGIPIDDLRGSLTAFTTVLDDPGARVKDGLHFGGSYAAFVEMGRSLGQSLRTRPRGRSVCRGFKDWADSIVLECCDNVDQARLDLSSYMQVRLHSIAMLFVSELLFFSNDYTFPEYDTSDPVTRQLYILSAQSVAYLNDVISLPKELAGDGAAANNAVVIEYDLLIETGIEAEMAAKLALERTVRRFRASREAVSRYSRWLPEGTEPTMVVALQDMVRAVTDWHVQVSQRYLAAVK